MKWEDAFHILEQFVQEYHRLPKRNEIYHRFRLGEWCSNQKRRVLLSGKEDRIRKLQAIGLFDADAGYLQYQWEQNYELLQRFLAEQHRVPKVTEVYRGMNLGAWYSAQKGMLQSADYPAERRAKIEALGITPATVQEDWERHYQDLAAFVEEYQRLPKQKEVYRGFNLGLWCTRQVQQAKNDGCSVMRRKKLEAVGLLKPKKSDNCDDEAQHGSICSYRDQLWDARYQLLCAFVNEYGRLPHAKERYQDTAIGQWYATQKSKMKKEGYPQERKEKLSNLELLK